MPKAEGYSCDGGCGSSVVLTHPAERLAEHDWHTDYGPRGTKTLYACSAPCMVRALERVHIAGPPALAKEVGHE